LKPEGDRVESILKTMSIGNEKAINLDDISGNSDEDFFEVGAVESVMLTGGGKIFTLASIYSDEFFGGDDDNEEGTLEDDLVVKKISHSDLLKYEFLDEFSREVEEEEESTFVAD